MSFKYDKLEFYYIRTVVDCVHTAVGLITLQYESLQHDNYQVFQMYISSLIMINSP